MKHVRDGRKALLPLRRLIGRPAVHTWTGNKAFNRVKVSKFRELARYLDADEFRAFCAAIGWVEINWAMMESQLDRWTQLIYLGLDGKAFAKQIPMGFARKSQFLRKSFTKIQRLSKFKPRALDILNRADSLAGTRHDLTHAVITSVTAVNGKFPMENRRVNHDGTHTVKNVHFDARAFPDLSQKLANLGGDAIALSSDLLDEFRDLHGQRI
jgi:hypothetical protein